MKRIYYTLLLITATCLTACGDFLEPQSQSEFSPEEVYTLNEILLGEAMPLATLNNKPLHAPLYLMDDDVTTHPYVATDPGNLIQYQDPNFLAVLQLYSWQPYYSKEMDGKTYTNFNLYENYYSYIVGCNIPLDYLDKVSGKQEEKDYVKAQALTLRGYYYLQLVNIYAMPYHIDKTAMGVPLKLTGSIENRLFTRNTVEEVYKQIEEDLLEAEQIFMRLPDNKQWKKDHRPSLPLTQMVLARMYLYMENWGEAAKYAQKVIANGRFSLYDLNTYPLPDRVNFPNMATYDSPESIWVFGETSQAFQFAVIALHANTDWKAFEASEELMNSFEEGDLRKDKYIVSLNEGSRTSYRIYGKVLLGTNRSNPLPESGVNGFTFRLSEAYLIYAEAKAQLAKAGDATGNQEAIRVINDLRKKRFTGDKYQPIAGINNDELIALIKAERRRELCFEAHRWFDLRRYGMPEIKHTWVSGANTAETYTLKANDPFYALPIPHMILDQNTNLVQNPLSPERLPN